ncbi:MAG: hypothetical protein OER95_18655, partial [Acidimicrobiia bacterium]|nr:hypothetical protein [Acidimicrobiia bacterium]
MAAEDGNGEASLVLDEFDEKLSAFNALRKSDHVAADAILEQVGASDDVDRQIVLELASKRPLGHADRFPEAHSGAIRALEVLDRNGGHGIKVRRMGPLAPIGQWVVQQVVLFIIRSHQRNVINNMVNLYNRRAAAALVDDPDRPLLIRARIQVERVAPGFRGSSLLGVPTFLLGGAVLSTIIGTLQAAALTAFGTTFGKVAAIVVLFMVLLGLSWAVLKGAAIARRRIKLTVERPLAALYQTIGRCGNPPRDHAHVLAL